MFAGLGTLWLAMLVGAGEMNGTLKAGLILLMLTVALSTIAVQRGRKARSPGMQDYSRDLASRLRQQQGVQQDLEQIVVQISELARQLNAQMDTRFAKLEHVIAEADEKIHAMEALLRQAAGVRGVDMVIGETADDQTAPGAEPAAPRPRRNGRKSARSERAPARAAKETARPEPTTEPEPPAGTSESRYGRIYALADQGLTAIEIARQTGQTTGEIELILNLRKTRNP